MSKLIVEVCKIEQVLPHTNADKLEIAKVKGWHIIVKKNEFKDGDLCIYFPPDSILPKAIYDDRLNNGKYLHELPKNEFGVRPEGRRVTATRLRGTPSYGVLAPIDSKWGDDLNWVEGTDVVEHFGVTKYEPPVESVEGDAERSHNRFHAYTSIENFGNYPNAIPIGDEVIMTEKIHGKNSRVGLVLDSDEEGTSFWNWMAGSHGVRRKEFVSIQKRFSVPDLIEKGICKETPKIGDVLSATDGYWQIEYVAEPTEKSTEQFLKVQVIKVDEDDFNPVLQRSEYWEPLTDNVKNMILHIKESHDIMASVLHEELAYSILVYGEIFGAGVQDMQYGLAGHSYRLFDIAINNKYLDFEVKEKLCKEFKIEMVPVLYKGPFNNEVLEQYTNGPTTMCNASEAGKFKGREGVVVTPTKEVHFCNYLGGRRIVKSVSADYLARKDGTEAH